MVATEAQLAVRARCEVLRDSALPCARLPVSRVPGLREVGVSAMEEPVPRLAYLFVFECEKCMREVSAHFQTEDPQSEFHLTCACGWQGTRRGAQAKKVICQDADSSSPDP